MYGICLLPVVAGRAEPSDRSEMVTQILFGEWVEIVEAYPQWVKCRVLYDRYSCWVSANQVTPVSDSLFEQYQQRIPYIVTDLIGLLKINYHGGEEEYLLVPAGSILYYTKDKQCVIVDRQIEVADSVLKQCNEPGGREDVVNTALQFLGAPYLWGGKTVMGVDCSGFTQIVYKLNHHFLPRDAYQQAEMGELVSFTEEAKPGDLAFFDNKEGKIIHVGIMLSHDKIIHASGKVRIDRLDHFGIYNEEKQAYTHHLRVIKKMFS